MIYVGRIAGKFEIEMPTRGFTRSLNILKVHMLNLHKNRVVNQMSIYINSNEVSTQDQQTIDGMIHKCIYMAKPLNCINVGSTSFA